MRNFAGLLDLKSLALTNVAGLTGKLNGLASASSDQQKLQDVLLSQVEVDGAINSLPYSVQNLYLQDMGATGTFTDLTNFDNVKRVFFLNVSVTGNLTDFSQNKERFANLTALGLAHLENTNGDMCEDLKYFNLTTIRLSNVNVHGNFSCLSRYASTFLKIVKKYLRWELEHLELLQVSVHGSSELLPQSLQRIYINATDVAKITGSLSDLGDMNLTHLYLEGVTMEGELSDLSHMKTLHQLSLVDPLASEEFKGTLFVGNSALFISRLLC